MEEPQNKDFIRRIIEQDVKNGLHNGKVITRFPPEPNGFLHIGHAKSICLNFGIAEEFHSVCHLRFDDTDPTKEDVQYENAIQEDIHWLGFDWQKHLFHASDYFEKMYDYAVGLIKAGKAYVCSLNEEEIRQHRGTVTTPGKISPFAGRSISENLDLFSRMRAGEFKDGAYVLRARIDMASPNMKMRDPLLYRIRHAHHYMTGDKWCLYPMYDYAHPISDAIEGVTHSICTLEFENNRELYDWVLDNLEVDFPSRPHQYEFARLDLKSTVMSKRKLLQLIENKFVTGWDDPRLPTISGLRRRGCTPESIRKFCELVGVAKSNSTVELSQFEFCLRDDLNTKAPRVMAVLKPLKVIIDNYPANRSDELNAPYWPHDIPKEGSRKILFTREIYIERDDFMENPPEDFYRLAPGKEVRLRYAYCITCNSFDKDPQSGEILALHCTYDPETRSGEVPKERKVKGTIHWVPSNAIPTEIRLYNPLLLDEPDEDDFLKNINPNSLEILKNSLLEPSLKEVKAGDRFQFERQGYFFVDPKDSQNGKPVFNRIVTLKDSRTKKRPEGQLSVKAKTVIRKNVVQKQKIELPELSADQQARSIKYQDNYRLSEEEARIIVQDLSVADFFEKSLEFHPNANSLANWINNELLGELKEKNLSSLYFGPKEFAELIALLDEGTISVKSAKGIFKEMAAQGGYPKDIVKRDELFQINNEKEIEPIVDQVLATNGDNVKKYQLGNDRLFGFFVGQILKETKGRANPELVNRLLLEKLKGN